MRVPVLKTRLDRSAFAEPALMTVTVYVLVVVPFCAVTTVVITLLPTERFIDPEAVPLVTEVPFTVTVAVASATVGVTVMEVILLATDAV